MAKFAYRCMKCRFRNMFARKLEDYKRNKRCARCKHWRFYWDKERNKRTFEIRTDRCYCSSYPFPHRPESKMCEKNPNAEFNIRVHRYKEDPMDVAVDISFEGGEVLPPDAPCPF